MTVIHSASHSHWRRPEPVMMRSVARSASGSPYRCSPCTCGMRVSVCVLNANADPATSAAARSPVQAYRSAYPASALNARPAITIRLKTSTGEPPSQASGAPRSAGTINGSEKASVSCAG